MHKAGVHDEEVTEQKLTDKDWCSLAMGHIYYWHSYISLELQGEETIQRLTALSSDGQ